MLKLQSLFLCFFLTLGLVGLTQQEYKDKIDSLQKAYPSIESAEEKVKNLQTQARYYEFFDLKKFFEVYNKSAVLAKEKKLYELEASAYINMGGNYFQQGNLDSAGTLVARALTIAERENNIKVLAGASLIMGNIQVQMGQLDDATKYYQQGYDICIENKDYKNLPSFFFGLSIIENRKGNYKGAIKLLRNAADSLTAMGDLESLGGIYNNIGKNYSQDGNLDSCIVYFRKSLTINLKLGSPQYLPASILNIAATFAENKQYDSAIAYFDWGMAKAREHQMMNYVMEGGKEMSYLYSILGDYEKAYNYLWKSYELKDSLNLTEIASKIQELKTQYETEKLENEKELAAQKALAAENKQKAAERDSLQSKLEKEKSEQKSNLLMVILAASLLVIGGIIFLLIQNKKNNALLSAKNDQLGLAYAEIETKNTEIIDSINYAKRLQDAALPDLKILDKHVEEHALIYLPKDIVAGDFYWLNETEEQVFFAVADCTGHGVPGAMVSVVCMNALFRSTNEFNLKTTGEILDRTSELVESNFTSDENDIKDGMDICLVKWDKQKQEIQYSGANNPLWIIRKKEIIELKATKQPVGKYANKKPFESENFQTEKGDLLVLFSDGYIDQFGGDAGEKAGGKKLKKSRFKDLILQNHRSNSSNLKRDLEEAFENWKGDFEQLDDVCVWLVQL